MTPTVLNNYVSTFATLINYKASTQYDKGDIDGAIETRRYLIRKQDSLNNAFSANQLKQVKEIYHIDELLLEKQKIQDMNYRIGFIFLGVCLLLMLLFYLYTRYVSGKIAVVEKKTAEAALQAETDNIAKERLKSEISHDIRTPMNAIIGMTTIASMHIDDRERIVDCLKKIMVSSKLLLNLINEVLDMSKVESGHILLTDEEFDMGELLQSVITMVQTSVSQKFQDFRVHLFQVKHEKLIGDVQRIQQVLLNLLSNAIKYTPDYGKITLEIREKPIKNGNYGLFEVTVIDNGIGIKPDFLHKVFEPFERAEDATLRNIQGTGLGMAISRNIAHMMNGEIQVESEYGKGSRFTIDMPLVCRDQKPDDKIEVEGLEVLVVDDDKIACLNTSSCLREIRV